ncbi:MAG: D-glycero-D-manno-heptose 1-phosphate guanosyltransferase, partial [Methyloprofundus sp.]|nr:D-glycero-D-manno-heptose 1-phosphate guanosyltransferase [Methyloprofundus sp.]
EDYFKNSFAGIELDYAVEEEPLGTGGAILNALSSARQDNVFIINGDTFFNVDLKSLLSKHLSYPSDLTLSLKPMQNFDRYGCVEVDENHKVSSFKEKELVVQGNINGGIYILNKKMFQSLGLPKVFSFEEFMQKNMNDINIYADIIDHYFIDIGIPEDYKKAQNELEKYL